MPAPSTSTKIVIRPDADLASANITVEKLCFSNPFVKSVRECVTKGRCQSVSRVVLLTSARPQAIAGKKSPHLARSPSPLVRFQLSTEALLRISTPEAPTSPRP
jgi:hypothetical protein